MKKIHSKHLSCIILACFLFTMNMSVFAQTSVVVSLTGISVNKTTDTFKVGASDTLKVTITPKNASNKTVTWTSSDSSIVSVTKGKIKGVAAGLATISVTAVDGTLTATCDVTVNSVVTGVTLDKNTDTLIVGGSDILIPSIAPDTAANTAVTWKSSNSSVASVDAAGVITGVKNGKATITVTTADAKKTAKCVVTVKTTLSDSETSVGLNKATDILDLGSTDTLIAKVNAEDTSVTWSSSDETVATVSDSGLVTAVKLGSTTITVTTTTGSKTDSCVVTVVAVTDNTTANNVTTLGLVGTQVSTDKSSVSTAEIAAGKVVITSVGTGTAVITVAANGAITIGTITKYAAETNKTTANDVSTLGLIGTTAALDTTGVAKVRIMAGKIEITAVGPGTAKITITDAGAHTATPDKVVSINDLKVEFTTIDQYTKSAKFTFTALTGAAYVDLLAQGSSNSCGIRVVEAGTLTPNSTSITLELTSDTYSSFWLQGWDENMDSLTGTKSSNVLSVCANPFLKSITDFVGTAGDKRATFTFSASPGASYVNIYQSENGWFSESKSTLVSPLSDTSTSATVTGLENGKEYSFYVYAINGNNSVISSRIKVTPAVPAGPVIVAQKLGQVTGVSMSSTGIVSWTKVPNATSYTVTVTNTTGSSGGGPITDISSSAASQDITSLVTGYGDYTATVTAVGDGVYYTTGDVSAASGIQSAGFATNPMDFSWSGNTAGWSAPFFNVPGSYDVQLYKGGTKVGAVVNTTSTSYDFTALITANGSGTYTYTLLSKGDGKFILDYFSATIASEGKVLKLPMPEGRGFLSTD